MKLNPHLKPRDFILRNLTWGLPVNLGGALFASLLLLTGHKPQKYGSCIQFEIGKNWGGGNLGLFIFTGKNAPDRLKMHEHGHSIQNCYFGPLMPFLVNVPSSARFWARKLIKKKLPKVRLRPYDSIWFERQATELGRAYMHAYNEKPLVEQESSV